MIKDYLTKKGVSVYVAAKESQIPYTTLNELVNGKKSFLDCNFKTIQKLSSYLGMSMEELFCQETDAKIKVATTWTDAKHKKYTFPVIDGSEYYDASRIHPLKQRIVKKIYNACSGDPRIKSIFVCGSSTNIRCNPASDTDLSIALKENSPELQKEVGEKIQGICEGNAHIVWFEQLGEGMNGVQIK